MRLLLIHQNFPGQFRRMAPLWAKYPNWEVLGLGRKRSQGMTDIKWVGYELHREPDPSKQHPYLISMESAVLHGQATARALLQLKQKGYTAKGVGIKMRYKDFTQVTRELMLDAPTQEVATIRKAAGQALKRAKLDKKIRLLGVKVYHLERKTPSEEGVPTGTDGDIKATLAEAP